MEKNLSGLLTKLRAHDLLVSAPADDLLIRGFTYDSRDVRPGMLFSCKGNAFKDQYLFDAEKAGASCYLSDREIPGASIPLILVWDIRKAMAVVAICFTDEAYQQLFITGITGTKGKTTTTFFLRGILDEFEGRKTAVLSSVEDYAGGETTEAHLTTPEAFEMHRFFREAARNGIRHLTMEVSSQANLHHRVYGMRFPLGIFLNISEDHIGDLEHPNFENYLGCKLEFLTQCDTVLVSKNTDQLDRVLQAAREGGARVVLFGPDQDCDVRVTDIQRLGHGFTFTVTDGDGSFPVSIDMEGRFNVENALAAIAAAREIGVPVAQIQAGLRHTAVQGRMNLFEKDGVTVIVDYAHNHLSFLRLYESLAIDYPDGRIVAVFGCPGGHARLRRRDLGVLTSRFASYAYLTTEDPQFEDPQAICEEIATFLAPVPYEIIVDRVECIETALQNAKPGDVIIVTGKGEEFYQKVRGEYLHYESDLAIVRRMMESGERGVQDADPR